MAGQSQSFNRRQFLTTSATASALFAAPLIVPGRVLGLNGGADFYGRNPKELRAEFRKSLNAFLEVCKEKGIEPRRHYSGKFNLRIPPDLHEQLAITAKVKGTSVNKLAQEALQKEIANAD